MKKMKSLTAFVVALLLVLGMAGCGAVEDETIRSVKNGHPTAYPDISYDQAFGEFYSTPQWTHFKGTRNGPDDDNDGKPDYVEENIEIVEFTGKCTYMDKEVTALIQFQINDDDTFSAEFCSLNDIPQSTLVLYALISNPFEEYQEKHFGKKSQNSDDLDDLFKDPDDDQESVSDPDDDADEEGITPDPDNTIKVKKATCSKHAGNGKYGRKYGANMAVDGKAETCWMANGKAGGAGNWIKLDFGKKVTVTGIKIINGNTWDGYYKGSFIKGYDELFEKNGRLCDFELEFSDGTKYTGTAQDSNESFFMDNIFYLDEPVVTSYVKLKVKSGYEGYKYANNVCIGEIQAFC